jgi:hypothetical protein
VADGFAVRLADQGTVTPAASEAAFDWKGDQVTFSSGGSPRVRETQEGGGLFVVPTDGAKNATVTSVKRILPHRVPLEWNFTPKNLALDPNVEGALSLSTRLRVSVWAFGAPFAAKKTGSDGVELNKSLLTKLEKARIDDVSLVHTLAFDYSTQGVRWSDGFKPLGETNRRKGYCAELIRSLHAIGVQVLAGYTMVEGTRPDKSTEDFPVVTQFANWLAGADEGKITKHAQAIAAFFEKNGTPFDGLGFDIETKKIKKSHRDNLGLLFKKIAEALSDRNAFVTYANLPFLKKDGEEGDEFMKAQPYAHAALGPNIVARPMCYGGVSVTDEKKVTTTIQDSRTYDAVETSVACALAKPKDGGGLHPAQLQMALWPRKIDEHADAKEPNWPRADEWCRKILRPNRVGLMLYPLPQEDAQVAHFLDDVPTWEKALNPDEAPPEKIGQPLQVPHGYVGPPQQGGTGGP